jgi:hypothetical protein
LLSEAPGSAAVATPASEAGAFGATGCGGAARCTRALAHTAWSLAYICSPEPGDTTTSLSWSAPSISTSIASGLDAPVSSELS